MSGSISGISSPSFDHAEAMRAEGWECEISAGGHLVDAAIAVGDHSFGTAAVHIGEAICDKMEAAEIYSSANYEMIAAAQAKIAESSDNSSGSGSGCAIS